MNPSFKLYFTFNTRETKQWMTASNSSNGFKLCLLFHEFYHHYPWKADKQLIKKHKNAVRYTVYEYKWISYPFGFKEE